MPGFDEFTPRPRKDLHVFYILDTSGSMTGEKIDTLNRAMEETTKALSDVAKKNADANLKIAVLEFNTGCKWVTSNGPEDLAGDFIWDPLKAGGLTDVGTALKEVNAKLDRSAFLGSMMGAMFPIVIFMSDGFATDDYNKALEEIRKNRWWQRATKIGFALGDDADLNMIGNVVGNSEAVIRTNDLEVFKKLLKFVSVTSSMLRSKPVGEGEEPTTPDDILEGIEDILEDEGVDPSKVLPNAPISNPEPKPDWEGDDEW